MGVLNKKEGPRKIAVINSDPSDQALNKTLGFEVSFDAGKTIVFPCRALDGVNAVCLRLSNMPFSLRTSHCWAQIHLVVL